LEVVVNQRETLDDWAQVLGEHVVFAHTPANAVVTTVDWQPAAYVSICWKVDSTLRDLAWIRRSDRLIVRPAASRHRERGWPDSIKNLQELTLVPPTNHEGDVFVVYDKVAKRLSRQQRRQELTGRRLQPADEHDVHAAAESLHDGDDDDRPAGHQEMPGQYGTDVAGATGYDNSWHSTSMGSSVTRDSRTASAIRPASAGVRAMPNGR